VKILRIIALFQFPHHLLSVTNGGGGKQFTSKRDMDDISIGLLCKWRGFSNSIKTPTGQDYICNNIDLQMINN
jgi:hypothetical protein